ncbi:MAG: gfo/Idh/MocA family oxidoreductase [Rhodobacteraceae bacterium]|jgi:predicted dehydrogenase|uniref:Putative dehydrogenase n=1 Tax=Salipiger profundus TaxID=1229727 RepID=A0A1U7D9B1_9RHOB|nr:MULTISPECIES: Gfo/Idh/MocA family oxidoreductase [Salipiger]APX24656.1 putative dehydrogenase [Salipiger profundus]MAB06454.1 gfo/Idh/MocA family oxidoreductase [Paracoccaceae bacterium]GFZ96852.1 oxidoreductase [Salipiger profundus]SFB80004.1 Predicted dehydrogenase [Salipiger profundus]
MADRIKVGFIGLNPDSNWAFNAHLPALKTLTDDFEIVGVANSTPESGQLTAEAHGLTAFDTPADLVASDQIDLVVVTVKVPYHFELVSLALNAGKHVYCEWPLGNGLDEARKLAALAEEKGVVAVAGTQARAALEVEHLKTLIADGYVGRVRSTSLIGSGGNWANTTSAALYYLFDKANGGTMEDIPMGHTLAAVRDVLGDFGPLSATKTFNYDTVTVTDTGEERPKTAPDQVMVQGQMASGAALSLHYRGGTNRGTNFLWEINGTEGDIQVTAGLGHAQMVQLTIKGARGDETELTEQMPDASLYEGKPEFPGARNVAGVYARMANDIRSGSRTAPSFADAVELHEVLDRIDRSASNS